MNTLFDLDAFENEPEEPIMTRYVIVVIEASGDRSYYCRTRKSGQAATDDFIALDPGKPIPIRGTRLPTRYKTAQGARKRVSDLYRRHKRGGEGINIWIQTWQRTTSETCWHEVGAFK